MKNQLLWDAIHSFQLDKEDAEFNFSQRLARDNKWTHAYALLVIEEYKRFVYLCCVSEQSITPSDEVDQAWHLHLTYTRSYWDDLCAGVLNRSLHHNPTEGGDSERMKYSNCYDFTFKMYEEEFGSEPPADIWPNNQHRFEHIHFQRINLDGFWLIKKPHRRIRYILGLLLFIGGSLSFMGSESTFPWLGFIIIILTVVFIIRGFKNGRGGSGGGGSSCWGCAIDSGHDSGCNSGCGSGCGGCGGD